MSGREIGAQILSTSRIILRAMGAGRAPDSPMARGSRAADLAVALVVRLFDTRGEEEALALLRRLAEGDGGAITDAELEEDVRDVLEELGELAEGEG